MRVANSEFRVASSEFRVASNEFRVASSEFRVKSAPRNPVLKGGAGRPRAARNTRPGLTVPCKRGLLAAQLFAAACVVLTTSGCTRESVRIALRAQQRADQVHQTVFDRQHEGLRILLYRDLIRRLETAGPTLSADQRAVVNAVWNERDLIEFWAIQNERAKALRLIGVDAKLYSDKSPLELLLKSLTAKVNRLAPAVAKIVGEQVFKKDQ